jgi:outer membrane protein assembly factor BamB
MRNCRVTSPFLVTGLLGFLFLLACGKQVKGGDEGVEKESEGSGEVSEWSLFRGDSAMQGVSEETLSLPLDLAWSFETGRPIVGTAAIEGGRVFIGSTDGIFYCLDLHDGGKELWSQNLDYAIEGTAAVVGDKVIIGGQDGILRAFDKESGKPAWQFETEAKIAGGVNVWEDPEDSERVLLLVGSHDYYLYAIDAATGEKEWEFETENYVNGTPTIADGNAIIGGCDNYLRLISMDSGEQKAEIDIAAYMANTLAVRDGIAYVAHYGGMVESYDLETREKVWQFEVPRVEFQASPAVTEKSVYVGSRDKKLRCLDRVHGEQVWEFTARRNIDSSPVACPNAVFVGADDARLYALHPETGEELWSYELGDGVSASPAVAEGYLVIGAQDGVVYAFRAEASE